MRGCFKKNVLEGGEKERLCERVTSVRKWESV